MDSSATRAVSAYTQALERARTGAAGGADEAGGADAAGGSFGALLRDQIQDMVQTGKEAEKQSLKAASGKADLVDVVTAVNNAEVALQTVVAVRDRMVQAYQEIMRMPI
jgi:flagellar hook-basal body complex protein FliE